MKATRTIFAGDITAVHDSALNTLGARARDGAGNEYVYLKGVANTAQYSWVSFDEAYLTTLLAANAVGRVAIAQAAVVANKYGWYLIYGTGLGKVLAGFADDGKVYATATAGSVDDAVVAGDLVVGAIGRSAIASGTATMELNYPFATDALG
jgi:hypothetical protein